MRAIESWRNPCAKSGFIWLTKKAKRSFAEPMIAASLEAICPCGVFKFGLRFPPKAELKSAITPAKMADSCGKTSPVGVNSMDGTLVSLATSDLLKRCPHCDTYKPRDAFYKSSIDPDGLRCHCKQCLSERYKSYYRRNATRLKKDVNNYRLKNLDRIKIKKAEEGRRYPEKIRARARRYVQANRARVRAIKAKYYSANKERLRPYHAQYQKNNFERHKQANRRYMQRYPDRANAKCTRRRAIKLRAVPKWADLKKIETIYSEAQRQSVIQEKCFHVDHIVPLVSKLVCGLHCEDNLQVLSGSENAKKSNVIWPDMP